MPHFVTVVVAVAVLFARSGSGELARTVAVFVSVAPARDGLTTIVTVVVANTLSVPSAHVIRLPLRLHEPCDGVADTNSTSAGSRSNHVTPRPADGPKFRPGTA